MLTWNAEIRVNIDIKKWSEEAVGNALSDAVAIILTIAKEKVPIKTGNLQRSIVPYKVNNLHWQVIAGAPYAGYVEFGTCKMPPRPFLSQGVDEAMKYLEGAFRE